MRFGLKTGFQADIETTFFKRVMLNGKVIEIYILEPMQERNVNTIKANLELHMFRTWH